MDTTPSPIDAPSAGAPGPSPVPGADGGSASTARLVCLLLAALVATVYGRTTAFPFVTWDDQLNLWGNPHIADGLSRKGLLWALTTHMDAGWMPVTWISRMTDISLFGLWAGGHHLVNAALHGGSAIVFFLALRRMTGRLWESALAAALFAVHPIHVESVAWVTERKDVLAGFFWMLTLHAYAGYAERPTKGRYGRVFLFFLLGLLSKPTVVTLPFVLLLLDFWPIGRLRLQVGETGPRPPPSLFPGRRGVLLEKGPFLFLSAAMVLFSLRFERKDIDPFVDGSLLEHGLNALRSYAAYLGKGAFPSGLPFFFPFPTDLASWRTAAAGALLAAVTVLAVRRRERRGWFLAGWLWFLGAAVPSIGLVRYALHGLALRNAYLPMAGIYVAVAWGAGEAATRLAAPRKVATAAVLWILALAAAAWLQAGFWRSPEALYGHSMEVTGENRLCRYSLGKELFENGRWDEAEPHLRRAMSLPPDGTQTSHMVLLTLGTLMMEKGRTEEALALRKELFFLLARDGYTEEALTELLDMARFLERKGDIAGAIDHYRSILALDPGMPQAHMFLAALLARRGDLPGAVDHYRLTLARAPEQTGARMNLAILLARQGDLAGAAEQYRRALALVPNEPAAHLGLGVVMARQGNLAGAVPHFREALRLRPDYEAARRDLEKALAERGK